MATRAASSPVNQTDHFWHIDVEGDGFGEGFELIGAGTVREGVGDLGNPLEPQSPSAIKSATPLDEPSPSRETTQGYRHLGNTVLDQTPQCAIKIRYLTAAAAVENPAAAVGNSKKSQLFNHAKNKGATASPKQSPPFNKKLVAGTAQSATAEPSSGSAKPANAAKRKDARISETDLSQLEHELRSTTSPEVFSQKLTDFKELAKELEGELQSRARRFEGYYKGSRDYKEENQLLQRRVGILKMSVECAMIDFNSFDPKLKEQLELKSKINIYKKIFEKRTQSTESDVKEAKRNLSLSICNSGFSHSNFGAEMREVKNETKNALSDPKH